ncbi:MAG: cobaltochelatase subunit CobN, partial [Archaeoglobales archaeon]|nr:cobaltochelatase subunit CobN [Archaeoglobales archaeon]
TNAEIREMKDEIERIVRAKLLNDRWIEEMKKHGYRGANEFSKKILHLYGWSATTKLVEDWVFDEIAENYVLNEEMKKFFVENNVYALEEIARRLVEAKERGLWKASEERLRRIREIYAEIEGILEEDLVGDVQGGEIRFLNSEDVEDWKQNLKELEKAFEVIK